MSQSRGRGKKTTAQDSVAVRVLAKQEYESLRKERKTVEFHLASALFPQGKITANALTKFVEEKVPATGKYNVVFHFRRTRKDELTSQLEKAWLKMENAHGGWFVMLHDTNRDTARKRVRKVAPKGSITTSAIDSALKSLSKKNIVE